MVRKSRVLAALSGSVVLSGCAALQAAPSPIRPPARNLDATKIAHVSVSTTNVIRWEEIADDLNRPQFNPTPQELLADAVQVTSSVNAQTTDTFNAALSALFAGTSINRTRTDAVDDTGKQTNTSSETRSRQTPATPDVSFNFAAPGSPQGGPDGVGTEAQLKYDIAKALAEEVAIKNREVSSIAQRTGYRPYFVNMKVAVEPHQRLQPYDLILHLKFSTPNANTSGATPKLPIVIPLLVTDAIESTREAQTAQIVRQLGAALRASGGFVGASASLQRTLSRLDQTLAQRSNSLLTVAQEDGAGVRVRLGANAYGEAYELISRTHSLSLIVLIPVDVAKDDNANHRIVHVAGTLEYEDAGGPRLKTDPAGNPTGDVTASNDFEVPRRVTATCPDQQDAPIQITSVSDKAPKFDVLTLNGVEGFNGRRVQATITAPAPHGGRD